MSSNHKAPLTAFVVVAIACVVVLATNSMRSYARDAWRSFAAPVVGGLQLIEVQHKPVQTGDVKTTVTATASHVPAKQVSLLPTSGAAAKHRSEDTGGHKKAKGVEAVAPIAVTQAPAAPVTSEPTASAASEAPVSSWSGSQASTHGKHLGWSDDESQATDDETDAATPATWPTTSTQTRTHGQRSWGHGSTTRTKAQTKAQTSTSRANKWTSGGTAAASTGSWKNHQGHTASTSGTSHGSKSGASSSTSRGGSWTSSSTRSSWGHGRN